MNASNVAISRDVGRSDDYSLSGRWRTGALVLLTALACSLMMGCDKKAPEETVVTGLKPKRELPAPQRVDSEETAEYNKIADKAAALFAKRDFAGLDALAHELRESKRFFSDGRWLVRSLYWSIEKVSDKETDSEYLALIGKLNDWIKARPESITPRVALGDVYVDYAWKARGSGWASTVTAEGGRLMEERLAAARKVLIAARNLPEKCPRWWSAMQDLALGQGWDAGTYDALCEEGLRLYPGYYSIYFAKAYHLLPRWYGKTGDWERFAEDSAKKLGGDEGEMLYARMIWQLVSMNVFKNIFEENSLKWERVKRSFEVLLKANPDSLGVMSAYARVAVSARDCRTARALFEKIGGRVDSDVWSKQDDFVNFRTYAYAYR